jgi:hypothetical protein
MRMLRVAGKPYDKSNCNVELFNKDLEPFNRADNPVGLTKSFTKPKDLFRSVKKLNYTQK